MLELLSAKLGDVRMRIPAPGAWKRVSVVDEGRRKRDINDIAELAFGRTDNNARERRTLRTELDRACTASAQAGGVMMYFAVDLWDGIPFPVHMTVYRPSGMRMCPAIDRSSSEVLGILRAGLVNEGDEIVEVEGQHFNFLRTYRVDADDWFSKHIPKSGSEDDAELLDCLNELPTDWLKVNYWCHIPDSKEVVLVAFSTSLSVIKNLMLELFDSILKASWFEAVEA